MSFLSPDPLSAPAGVVWETSPYNYAANNPLNLSDPYGLKPVTDQQMQAYSQTIDQRNVLSRAKDFLDDYGAYILAGVMIVGGVALMCTGIGGPVGLALMAGSGALFSGGVSVATQKYSKGAVDWAEVGVESVIGAATGFVGGGTGAFVSKTMSRGVGRVATGVAAGASEGATSGAVEYSMRDGEHTLSGFVSATISNGAVGAASGGIFAKMPKMISWGDTKNFKFRIYRPKYIDKDTLLFRGGNADQPNGSWWSYDMPADEETVRRTKAILPQWPGKGKMWLIQVMPEFLVMDRLPILDVLPHSKEVIKI